jgi:prepilin-type N-terminal cleavage/methylation domain-containing protein
MSRHEPSHPQRLTRAQRFAAARRAVRAGEAGYTLIELMIAMSMFAVVLTAVLALWDTASNAGYNESERSTALARESSGLDRMLTDLRQAFQVNGPTASASSGWMDIVVRAPNGTGSQLDYRIIYDCTKTDPANSALRACYRYQSPWTPGTLASSITPGVPSAGASSSVVIPRVEDGTSSDANESVFSSLSKPQGSASAFGPTYGVVTIRTPSSGDRQAFKSSNYNHDVVLTDSFYMRQLDFGR